MKKNKPLSGNGKQCYPDTQTGQPSSGNWGVSTGLHTVCWGGGGPTGEPPGRKEAKPVIIGEWLRERRAHCFSQTTGRASLDDPSSTG